jgi:phosphoglycolate phosphatase-like HAD superfamily hydrolase
MNIRPRRFTGVLLDIDGTLLLSNEAHARAWHDALAEAGYDVPVERLRRLIGMGGDKVMPAVAPGLAADRPPGSTISRRRGDIFWTKYAGTVRPAPGARALLERLERDGYRLAFATSAKRDELEKLVRAANVEGLVDTAASSDAGDSKPDPDIVEAALQRADLSARDAVMLGDTPYDLEAAGRAGVEMIGVRCGGWSDADLPGALAVYDDPADILRNYDSSCFGAVKAGFAGPSRENSAR